MLPRHANDPPMLLNLAIWSRQRRAGPVEHFWSLQKHEGDTKGTRENGGLQLQGNSLDKLAERVGFEPTVRFHVHTLSKRAP